MAILPKHRGGADQYTMWGSRWLKGHPREKLSWMGIPSWGLIQDSGLVLSVTQWWSWPGMDLAVKNKKTSQKAASRIRPGSQIPLHLAQSLSFYSSLCQPRRREMKSQEGGTRKPGKKSHSVVLSWPMAHVFLPGCLEPGWVVWLPDTGNMP